MDHSLYDNPLGRLYNFFDYYEYLSNRLYTATTNKLNAN